MNNNGLLLIFSGPSGAGKGTVLKELLNGNDNMKLSVSATTRTPREGECHGVHYFFMTKEEFEEQIANGQMLEHAEYCGKYYGTPSSQIMDWIEEGRDVVLEIEVQGARQILEKRLRYRNTEDEETIKKRLAVARQEMETARDYDYVIVNDTIEHTVEQINKIIAAEKLKVSRAKSNIERVLNND